YAPSWRSAGRSRAPQGAVFATSNCLRPCVPSHRVRRSCVRLSAIRQSRLVCCCSGRAGIWLVRRRESASTLLVAFKRWSSSLVGASALTPPSSGRHKAGFAHFVPPLVERSSAEVTDEHEDQFYRAASCLRLSDSCRAVRDSCVWE